MSEGVRVGERNAIHRDIELSVRETAQAQILGRVEARSVGRGADEAGSEVRNGAEVADRRGDLANHLLVHDGLRRAFVEQQPRWVPRRPSAPVREPWRMSPGKCQPVGRIGRGSESAAEIKRQ